jgi:hypothetical protein
MPCAAYASADQHPAESRAVPLHGPGTALSSWSTGSASEHPDAGPHVTGRRNLPRLLLELPSQPLPRPYRRGFCGIRACTYGAPAYTRSAFTVLYARLGW